MPTFNRFFRPLFSFARTNKTAALSTAKMFCITGNISTPENKTPWEDIKTIIEKVHKHVCGHDRLSDTDVLLKRNSLWNDEI